MSFGLNKCDGLKVLLAVMLAFGDLVLSTTKLYGPAQSKFFVATGPTSSFISLDGNHWKHFSAIGFHALEASPKGNVYAVGADGRFGRLEIQK